jgi:UDP-2,4-diacetamido-2,4,6-trideoxy-beta-L-altropyranose hydrolase
MKRVVLIRVDANQQIGTGHLYRTLALAGGLKTEGFTVIFALRSPHCQVVDLVCKFGHSYEIVPALHAFNRFNDAIQIIKLIRLKKIRPEWVIVDHYELDGIWEQLVRKYCSKLFVIDDLGRTAHFCDLLLDQNYRTENPYRANDPPIRAVLIGPKYALLNESFSKQKNNRTAKNIRINIFFGGVDPHNDTKKAIEAVLKTGKNIKIDVVVGTFNPNYDSLICLYEPNKNISIYRNTERMAELFAAADLGIGGGGSATWERIAAGLPALIIEQANNQHANAVACEKLGVGWYLGVAGKVSSSDLHEKLEQIFATEDVLKKMSDSARCLVDGKGLQRVIATMAKLSNDARWPS